MILKVEIIKLCLSFPLHFFFFFPHLEVIKSPKDKFTLEVKPLQRHENVHPSQSFSASYSQLN